ncbi:hypothetical protein KL949_005161 [Ogataea haglerorum]|uniref:uncharacterized protein n=1 Tax=Ogataea haglerorum TaxID=1937702 RepID=UPI001C8A8AFC|nr:uncharacterized protein KL911_005061 [Ogataea haglerorum]KAG7702512.1 hypothetical protein KL914_005172 [Ogataea haglerorum]KAG7713323.1 hypothetical protein KL913_005123 [Ogataea haglerorum]KAG7713694.1 hypothetical protein KL949_005161 [Ogataea haglerorum]KAG7744917.1 hypothetical protein KL912_005070 [Ogataea haglerorum]KAG7749854.1 hypothetical protein KL911_005061 [Ogataea haglerorum]
MFARTLLCTLLATAALASPIHQHHQHAKRNPAVTVVVTEYFDANGQVTSSQNPVPSGDASDSVSYSVASAPASGTSEEPYYPSSQSTSGSSSTASAGSVEAYAEKSKGITYSPYTDSGSCKSESEVASDIAKLSAYEIIRVYAPDCSCITNIMANMGSNQKIFAGLFNIGSLTDDIATLAEQVQASSQGWDGIYAVAIGNEWVQNGESASNVVNAVSSGRSTLSSKGWTGKVVTVDTVGAYQDNDSLCEASDFIAVNAHPYWNGNVKPEDSGSFLQSQLSLLQSVCGSEKSILICETGWPTQGDTFGQDGVPSTANQLTAIKSITDSLADQVIMFTTYNDYWKDPGSYGVEQYWGIYPN